MQASRYSIVQISYLQLPIQQVSCPLQQEVCMCYQFFRLRVLQPLSLLVYPTRKYKKQLFSWRLVSKYINGKNAFSIWIKISHTESEILRISVQVIFTFTTTLGRSSFNCCIVWYMELFLVSSAVICTIQSPIRRICCNRNSQHLRSQSSGISDITPQSNANDTATGKWGNNKFLRAV